jgi:hypothetical protein
MARHSRNVVVRRWVGTPDDVARLAHLARSAFDGDDADPLFELKVRMPGVEHEYGTPDEFLDAARELDLASIANVSIWGQFVTQKDGRVAGTLGTGVHGADFNVVGSDEHWVEGVTGQLSRAVAANARWPQHPLRWAIGLGAVATLLAGLFSWIGVRDGFTWWAIVLAALLAASSWVIPQLLIGTVPRLLQRFALVPDEYEPPSRRLLNETPTIVKAVLLLVAGAVIGEIFEEL